MKRPIETQTEEEDFPQPDIAFLMAAKTNMYIALGFNPTQSRVMAGGELNRLDLVQDDIKEELARNQYLRDQAVRAAAERAAESQPGNIDQQSDDDSCDAE